MVQNTYINQFLIFTNLVTKSSGFDQSYVKNRKRSIYYKRRLEVMGKTEKKYFIYIAINAIIKLHPTAKNIHS